MIDQRTIVITHGVLACLAWVIFFPLGSILVRLLSGPSTWKVHATVQIFSMAIFTAAVGTGLQMATRFRLLNNFHVIIGLAIFALMFIQALGGFLHHIAFKKSRHRTIVSYTHLWLGRSLITLGIINGGLGLWVNGRATQAQIIAYGVVAGVIWLAWLVTSAIVEARKGNADLSTTVASGKETRVQARERRMQDRAARIRLAQKQKMLERNGDWR